MKKYKQVTEEEFKQVKMLCEAGFKAPQIRSIIKRPGNPVYDMIKSETFEEYKKLTRERALRRQAIDEEGIAISPVEATEPLTFFTPEAQQQDIMNVLHSIDDSLKYLVHHMPVREKRGMFR